MVKTSPTTTPTKGGAQNGVIKDLSPFVKKFPTFKPTGSGFLDTRRKTQRAYLQDIVDHLWRNPENIMDAHSHVFSEEFQHLEELTASASNERKAMGWPDRCLNASKIPKAWVGSWILGRAASEKAKFTKDMIVSIEKACPESIPQLFEFMTQIPMRLPFPETMQKSEVVASKVFHQRAAQCGCRLTHLIQKGALSSNGQIDWSKAAYHCQWEGEKLTGVRFWSGAEGVVPDCVNITKKWILACNYSDSQASFEALGLPPLKLACWFPPGAPPNADRIADKKAKVLQTLADEVVERIAQAEARQQVDVVACDTSLLAPVEEAKQAAVTEKARARLVEAAAKRKANRRVAFS